MFAGMASTIQPNQFVAVRLPNDAVKVEQIIPNTLINLGKYGSFQTNQILGRPYHLTFEILDRSEVSNGRGLRIVSASELHADALIEQAETDSNEDGLTPMSEGTPPLMAKSNMNITDNASNQKLTMAEIEALKESETGTSRELIAKIMQSHSNLDQKTAFSLAKYTLRKHKKYLRRFCVLPLDTTTLTNWMMNERDFGKVMEIRNEMLGLIGCWANVHAAASTDVAASRYLIVDDTGGLVTAAMAERMGIIHSRTNTTSFEEELDHPAAPSSHSNIAPSIIPQQQQPPPPPLSNTLTLIHANSQPNLSLLRYFGYDSSNPSPTHPLHAHLRTLSWLQLLDPAADPTYHEPAQLAPDALAALKSSKRSTYHRKRRRWARLTALVHEARAGGFSGLIVASYTGAASVLHHLVPLLAGGAQVVVYHPHVEPVAQLADLYSTARRTAFLARHHDEEQEQQRQQQQRQPEQRDPARAVVVVPSPDFPVDPTLLLVPMVQTARVRRWQVLPGRTHPLMTGPGGAEGYVFAGTRVLPAAGKVSARGRAPRRRKAAAAASATVEDMEEDEEYMSEGDGVDDDDVMDEEQEEEKEEEAVEEIREADIVQSPSKKAKMGD